jgi:hypothetical protein
LRIIFYSSIIKEKCVVATIDAIQSRTQSHFSVKLVECPCSKT